jgi:hypothetical protein
MIVRTHRNAFLMQILPSLKKITNFCKTLQRFHDLNIAETYKSLNVLQIYSQKIKRLLLHFQSRFPKIYDGHVLSHFLKFFPQFLESQKCAGSIHLDKILINIFESREPSLKGKAQYG